VGHPGAPKVYIVCLHVHLPILSAEYNDIVLQKLLKFIYDDVCNALCVQYVHIYVNYAEPVDFFVRYRAYWYDDLLVVW